MSETDPANTNDSAELAPREAEKLKKVREYTKQLVPPEECLLVVGDVSFGQATIALSVTGGRLVYNVAATYDQSNELTAVTVSTQPDNGHTFGVWKDSYAYTPANHMIARYENDSHDVAEAVLPRDGERYAAAVVNVHDALENAYQGKGQV